MTLMNKEKLLLIKIKPSTYKLLLLMCPHLLIVMTTILLTLIYGLNTWIVLLSCIIATLSFCYYFRLHINLSSNDSIRLISKDKASNLFISGIGFENHSVKISGSSFSNDYLTILNLRDATKKTFTAVITKGCVDMDTYRKLRVTVNTIKFSE